MKRPQPNNKTPEIDYLLEQWDRALDASHFHRERGGTHGNIELAFSAHKLVWIAEMIRDSHTMFTEGSLRTTA